MIAVTSSREWVAVPPLPDDSTMKALLADWDDPHPVVAVVGRVDPPAWWMSTTSPKQHRLVGFAKVAEVKRIISPEEWVHTEVVDDHVIVDEYGVLDYLLRKIDLPHAEPGGLALRLEPLTCPNGVCAICPECGWCEHEGHSEDTCGLIGQPVTVVDLHGEIGRWER